MFSALDFITYRRKLMFYIYGYSGTVDRRTAVVDIETYFLSFLSLATLTGINGVSVGLQYVLQALTHQKHNTLTMLA
jgi:hypothetical protein